MKKNGLLSKEANTAELTNVLITAHQGGSLLSNAYRTTWPDRDALKYALAYLRRYAAHPQDRYANEASSWRTTSSQRART